MSLWQEPAFTTALTGTIVAVLLLVQTWAQERKRKLETELARDKQAEATSSKVVEKLVDATTGRISPIAAPLPPIEQRVTPKESPLAIAKEEQKP